jgi:hypothetical protein
MFHVYHVYHCFFSNFVFITHTKKLLTILDSFCVFNIFFKFIYFLMNDIVFFRNILKQIIIYEFIFVDRVIYHIFINYILFFVIFINCIMKVNYERFVSFVILHIRQFILKIHRILIDKLRHHFRSGYNIIILLINALNKLD